jgi:5-formyltetrahydrofolate cyclo-ligase
VEIAGIIPKEDLLMDKAHFRRRALARLRSIPPAQKRIADYRIRRTLDRMIRQTGAQTVMLYVPLAVEPDILPLIRRLRRRGTTVLVPFMEGESFRLVQYRLPLRTKRYGVREPNVSTQYRKEQIDLAVVPIIGTDPTGRRIGFGKGMYDRFFAREGARIGRVIFVQRVVQYAPEVVTDSWDLHGDMIVHGRLFIGDKTD